MDKIPHAVAEEIRRRELLGNYYKAGRTSVKKVLEDLEELMKKGA